MSHDQHKDALRDELRKIAEKGRERSIWEKRRMPTITNRPRRTPQT